MEINQTLRIDEFTAQLASAEPTPGGGGAAALVGAQAAALAEMAARVTAKSPRHVQAAGEMRTMAAKSAELRRGMLELIAADAQAFAALMAAWRLPREDGTREATIQAATVEATEVPLLLAEQAAQAVALALALRDKVTAGIRADAELAVLFGRAAVEGALHNVRVNAEVCRDADRKAAWDKRVRTLRSLAEMDAV